MWCLVTSAVTLRAGVTLGGPPLNVLGHSSTSQCSGSFWWPTIPQCQGSLLVTSLVVPGHSGWPPNVQDHFWWPPSRSGVTLGQGSTILELVQRLRMRHTIWPNVHSQKLNFIKIKKFPNPTFLPCRNALYQKHKSQSAPHLFMVLAALLHCSWALLY